MTSASLSTLCELRLGDMAAAYGAILQLPLDQQPDGHELPARLIDAERQGRAHRRTQLNLRMSKLRYAATLQDIDCAPERNLTTNQLAILTDPGWMARGENVLVTGATGCGKSYLACAPGNHAYSQGKRTLYFNRNRLCERIAVAKAGGTTIKWLDRLKKARLLLLDDFGLQPISHSVKLLLLQILGDRYDRAATVIVSQLPVARWHAYPDEPTVADAIPDRLLCRAHRPELTGQSLRKRPDHLSS